MDDPLWMLADTAEAVTAQGPEDDGEVVEVRDTENLGSDDEDLFVIDPPPVLNFYDHTDDHTYEKSTREFDRLVNSTHDYYGRIDQPDAAEMDEDHSYAYHLPFSTREASQAAESIADEDEEEMKCMWQECAFTGPKSTMETHVDKTHLKRGDRVCWWDNCGRVLSTRYLVVRHVRATHIGARPFKCFECDACFATKERLTLHSRAKHESSSTAGPSASTVDAMLSRLPYKCPIPGCTSRFPTTSERRHHVKRKHIRRPLPMCVDCDKYFANAATLAVHRRKKHPPLPTSSSSSSTHPGSSTMASRANEIEDAAYYRAWQFEPLRNRE